MFSFYTQEHNKKTSEIENNFINILFTVDKQVNALLIYSNFHDFTHMYKLGRLHWLPICVRVVACWNVVLIVGVNWLLMRDVLFSMPVCGLALGGVLHPFTWTLGKSQNPIPAVFLSWGIVQVKNACIMDVWMVG